MNHVLAFIKGIQEFRSGFTTSYDDYSVLESYDKGRELAHVATLRHFDNCA